MLEQEDTNETEESYSKDWQKIANPVRRPGFKQVLGHVNTSTKLSKEDYDFWEDKLVPGIKSGQLVVEPYAVNGNGAEGDDANPSEGFTLEPPA